jgi:RimJ/RimL family protein N-acetyltransferase
MPTKPLLAFSTSRFQCRDFVPDDELSAIALRLFRDLAAFEENLQSQKARPRVNFQFAIIDKTSNQLIGTAGLLIAANLGGDGNLIFNLCHSARGRYAVAFEVGYALISWAFEALSLTRITISPPNAQITGQKLARYAGFTQSGATLNDDVANWTLSCGDWEERDQKLWKNHGTPNH